MARRNLTPDDQRKIKVLDPFWIRVARGDVDLTVYSDEEIFSGRLPMNDGSERVSPKPVMYPQAFIDEQNRRTLAAAQEQVREGGLEGIMYMRHLIQNQLAEDKDRLKAASMLMERQFGKEPTKVQVSGVDRIESLFEALASDDDALLSAEEDDE